MTRLNRDTLPIALDYAREGRGVGIVHFGLGAFARAHLAWYTDRAMALAGGDWMITGVSLRSRDVAEALMPQDGLYALGVRSGAGTALHMIGSLAKVIVAPDDPQGVIGRIAAPMTRIISFTVTEKGYCRAADGSLDHTLAAAGIYPLLQAGLAARQRAGLRGVTLLSCDNLADNGRQLRDLLGQWLAPRDPALAQWVGAHCTFPCTMVDRIVPATSASDLRDIAGLIGREDLGAVMTEPFSQWVIEDRFAGARPAWDAVGATLVDDVGPYETAKLRMLNGAHSALAYLGLAAGHHFVHQAIADPPLRARIERLMREEAAPTIMTAPGQDLAAYSDALLDRFANASLAHRLAQIAMDGSQKIPQRWLATLAANRLQGRSCPVILRALGAWLRHMRGDNLAHCGAVADPRADEFAAAWARHGEDGIVDAVFGRGGLMAGDWVPWCDEARAILDGVRSDGQ